MLTSDSRVLNDRFAIELSLFEPSPRYNIAPTQQASVVVNDGQRTLDSYRWGLVPRWAKELSIGSKMINARAETLLERPSYKPAFEKRRCLVPANGFYEWKKKGDSPGPRRFELPDQELFAFAGLWESWRDQSGEDIRTFTIITTQANSSVRDVHERMPVIVKMEDETTWLNPASTVSELMGILHDRDQPHLVAIPVSSRVNFAGFDGPELLSLAS